MSPPSFTLYGYKGNFQYNQGQRYDQGAVSSMKIQYTCIQYFVITYQIARLNHTGTHNPITSINLEGHIKWVFGKLVDHK